MNQKHKDWLIENKITSLEELAVKLEKIRPILNSIGSTEKREIYFDFCAFMINKKDDLLLFFRENNKREVATYLSFNEAKNILLQRAVTDGNILFLTELVNSKTFKDLQKAVSKRDSDIKLRILEAVNISKEKYDDVIFILDINKAPIQKSWDEFLKPHIKFTILEENTMTDSAQEEVSRNHLSTRHKATSSAFHLDEVLDELEQKEKKVFEQLEDKTDTSYLCFERKEKIKKEFSNAGQKAGEKFNELKPQLSLLFKQFPKALEAISRCSEYGHNKYLETDQDYLNFSRVPEGSKAYADAGLRHRLQKGIDMESFLPHCYHVAWNALAELELLMNEK